MNCILIDNKTINLLPIRTLPSNPNLKKYAKALRQARNLPEVLFWQKVHRGKFHNLDFDRQKIIGNYIVDFYIKHLELIVEIDGSSHIGKEAYDSERELYLQSLGLKIFKTSAGAVKHNTDLVLSELKLFILKEYGV